MPPGRTRLPTASIVRSAGIVSDDPIAVIFSPSTKTSPILVSRCDDYAPFDQEGHEARSAIKRGLVGVGMSGIKTVAE